MAETIREFLVSLGYRVDGGSEDKFKRSVETATKGAIALGTALTAAALAVSAAVTRIAKGFDDVYYMSQRTNASAQNIKALSYAVNQLGGSYESARGSIESFGEKLRNNPGYESMVRQLGVVTNQNGKLRDTVLIAEDLAKRLAARPRHEQIAYINALGIDERTFEALKNGDYTRYIEEFRKKQEALGVDQARAAEAGHRLTKAWGSLSLTAATLGEKMMMDLAPSIERVIRGFDDFLVRHKDTIRYILESMGRAAELVGKGFTFIADALGPVVKGLDQVAQSFTGEGALTIAMAAFAAWLTGVWLLKILGAFTALSGGFAGMLIRLGINPVTLGLSAGIGAGLAINEGIDSHKDFHRRKDAIERPGGRNPFQAIDEADAKRAPKDTRTWRERNLPKWLGGKDAPAAISPAALSRRSAGGGGRRSRLTPEQSAEMAKGIQAAGKELGVSPDDIATAISYETGGTMHPWQKGPTTQWGTHRGLIQWGEPQARKYGVTAETSITDQMKAVSKYLRDRGVKPGDSLLQIYAAINAGHASKTGATDAHNGGASGTVADKVRTMGAHRGTLARLERQGGLTAPAYGGPGLPPLARFNPGALAQAQANAAMVGGGSGSAGPSPLTPGGAVTNTTTIDMNPKTEITILGGSDPGATASAVADAQKGVNGGLLRNMQGAVR